MRNLVRHQLLDDVNQQDITLAFVVDWRRMFLKGKGRTSLLHCSDANEYHRYLVRVQPSDRADRSAGCERFQIHPDWVSSSAKRTKRNNLDLSQSIVFLPPELPPALVIFRVDHSTFPVVPKAQPDYSMAHESPRWRWIPTETESQSSLKRIPCSCHHGSKAKKKNKGNFALTFRLAD